MKYKLIILFFLMCSCSAKSITRSDSDKISVDMSAFDYRISGQLFRGELNGDFSNLVLQRYLILLQQQSTVSEKDYADFIRDHELEFRIATNKYEFVVCFRSVKFHYGLCDIAGTNFIDRELIDNDFGGDLQKTATELLNRKKN